MSKTSSKSVSKRPGKSLIRKLKRIREGNYQPEDFIIADAKDGDMAFGVTSPGVSTDGSWKKREDYLNAMQALSESELVDIMLMSASSAEILSKRKVFKKSVVTPAVRFNDTTDIWMARGSCYRESPSQPFASADLESVKAYCSLGLYSMTFSNDLGADRSSLLAYRAFRSEAREHGLDHFLEIFNPAFDIGIQPADIGFYINDMIIKALAGVTEHDQPLFLKIQFNGAAAMEELSSYDPDRLIVGILGGSAGTTRDTFELACQAEQSGARVALFGRKINQAESPNELVKLMRSTIEKELTPIDAVKQYHETLKSAGIKPLRGLRRDLQITEPALKRARS